MMRLALLLHVHPGQIDGHKSDESIAARASRIAEGKHRIAHADAAFGVGEQLAAWWRVELPTHEVHTFWPGLPTTLPRVPRAAPPHPLVLLLGRAEDAELKGVHLAARAMRVVVDEVFRDAELVVRGVERGTEVALEKEVRSRYPKPRRFQSRWFEASREAIANDLATSTLVLQPSLEEGFGLVTLEAIAAGVPVLVSDRSGVARLIETVSPAHAALFVVAAGDERAWSEAITRVLSDVPAATRAVGELATSIAAAHSWDGAARELVSVTMASPHRIAEATRPTLLDQFRSASVVLGEYPRRTDGWWIERREEDAVRSWLATPLPEHENGVLLLIGAPGTGKSALLASLLQSAQSMGHAVLGIKADLLPPDVGSPEALRARLALEKPIIESLQEMAAVYGRATLVIDQLDALCEVVDRRTSRLQALIRVMREASELENVRVVASVRPFELRHEARLRAIHASAHEVALASLAPGDLRRVMSDVPIPNIVEPGLLTPHALDLMVQLLQRDGARFEFPASLGQLRERFWRAAIAGSEEREVAALAVAREMGDSGALWVARPGEVEARVVQDLVREGLLRTSSPGGERVGFRHQTLFDFARARGLIRAGGLAEYVREKERTLEIRPLVRSALLHLRSANRDQYHELADALFDASPLHVRLLVIDTLLEADTPTPREERLVLRAVRDAATRGRALNGLARRDGWLASLRDRISGWMFDYPTQSVLLASGFLRVEPNAALEAMEANWLGTEDGRERIVRVLSWSAQLGSDADPLLEKLVPHLVRTSDFELGAIGQSVARVDPRRAARFYVSCMQEEERARTAGETVSMDTRIDDELLELDIEPEFALDLIEPIVRKALSVPDRPFYAYDYRERLEQLTEQVLHRLSAQSREQALRRAAAVTGESPLLKAYLRALAVMPDHVAERVAWLAGDPARLSVDPESFRFIEAIAEQVGKSEVSAIDAAIDDVVRYPALGPSEPVEWRRDRRVENRRFRVALRARLPQPLRDTARRAFDEAEQHQLPGRPFEPSRGPQGGIVISPLSKAQLARASDDAIFKALEKERSPFELDEDDQPIGGADEIVSELGKLAEEDPERVARLAGQMRDRGELSRGRRLLVHIAEHHPEPRLVEDLVLSFLADEDAPLAVDEECAWALGVLTERGPLSQQSVQAILHRLESAAPVEPKEPFEEESTTEEPRRRLALFNGHGGGIVPSGAYRWIRALAHHYIALRTADPAIWARAVRGALRAERDPDPWAFALSGWDRNWAWLGGGEHALELLREIATVAPSPAVWRAITRVYAHNRARHDERVLHEWLAQLVEAEQWTAAAELAVLMATDKAGRSWVDDLLSEWRNSERASDFSTGVFAAVGRLLGDANRRLKASSIASSWAGVLRLTDVDLLFAATFEPETWKADRACAAILEALVPRILELPAEGLRQVVFLLERFLDEYPELALSLAEGILAGALAHEGGAAYVLISECLALSISLGLALPAEAPRTHALFEKALAADAPAALEALDTVDGRTRGGGGLRPALYRRPRQRLGRSTTRVLRLS